MDKVVSLSEIAQVDIFTAKTEETTTRLITLRISVPRFIALLLVPIIYRVFDLVERVTI